MTDTLAQLRTDFERVKGETRKAGSYLAGWAAWTRVSNFGERADRAPVQAPIYFTRQALHMAFIVTLYGQLEVNKKRVNLPSIITRLNTDRIQARIAGEGRASESSIKQNVTIATRRYYRWVAGHPTTRSLKKLRDNVVAHHGRDTDTHGAKLTKLTSLMARTVSVVDVVSRTLDGQDTDLKGFFRFIFRESVQIWEHGIDGDPNDTLTALTRLHRRG